MGRYYYTQNFDGKFGFGVQDSTDPELFGMYIDKDYDTSVDYYLEYTEDNFEEVKTQLDCQYDILSINKKSRIYSITKEDDIYDLYDRLELNKILYYIKGPNEEYTSQERLNLYSLGEDENGNHITGVLKDKELLLAWYRIELGLMIATELLINGECCLNADL